MLWALSQEANANPQHVGERSRCNTDCVCIKVKLHQTHNHIAFCSSRCHLLQTSSSNLLALCPCRTCPPFPCRDPQGHRGGHKPHQGIPDRTSWSNHSEGTYSILFWTDCYLKFKMSKEIKKVFDAVLFLLVRCIIGNFIKHSCQIRVFKARKS